MVQLFETGRHFCFAAAVNDVNMLGTEAFCAAGSIHCDIAAADDCDCLRDDHGRVALFIISLHQVDTGQILICGHHALERLALNVHEHRESRAGTDKDLLKAHLKQLVHRQNLADNHIRHDLNAHCL